MSKTWLPIGYGLVLVVVLGALAFKIFQPIQVLPRIRLAPGFGLVDQDGNRLTNEDLRGKLVLYNFTYTSCPEPCYRLDQTMREVQARLAESGIGELPMMFVTISFDPQRDTPEVLRAYAAKGGGDPSRWHLATTRDQRALKNILGAGFEIYYQEQGDGSYAFDPVFILVDGWGIIRGEYRYQTMTPDADRILRHIGVLAEEVRQSKGAASLAYEAAHYFLCYAP